MSVWTSTSFKFLFMPARKLAAESFQVKADIGCFIDVPSVDMRWLRRFRDEYITAMREPNRRYKVSWPVSCARCKCGWENLFRFRRCAKHFLGTDLVDKICKIDENTLHFNEAGSKEVGILELEGTPSVALRANHSATRERLTSPS